MTVNRLAIKSKARCPLSPSSHLEAGFRGVPLTFSNAAPPGATTPPEKWALRISKRSARANFPSNSC